MCWPIMPICGIPWCSNRPGKTNGLSFHKVPKIVRNQGDETRLLSEDRRRLWKAAIGRTDIITEEKWDRTIVCSRHFVDGQKAYLHNRNSPSWLPSLNLTIASLTPNRSSGEMPKVKRQSHRTKKRLHRERARRKRGIIVLPTPRKKKPLNSEEDHESADLSPRDQRDIRPEEMRTVMHLNSNGVIKKLLVDPEQWEGSAHFVQPGAVYIDIADSPVALGSIRVVPRCIPREEDGLKTGEQTCFTEEALSPWSCSGPGYSNNSLTPVDEKPISTPLGRSDLQQEGEFAGEFQSTSQYSSSNQSAYANLSMEPTDVADSIPTSQVIVIQPQ